jgi:hypothetical protein
MIDKLDDIAFRIHIEPLKTIQHAAKVDTVIKVLSNLTKSYNNFLEVEFLKNNDFRKAYQTNNNILNTIKNELNLLIIDLNFSSFEAALAPNLIDLQSPIFKDEIGDWKKDTFENYKEIILFGDFEKSGYVQKINDKYSETERNHIYKPFFDSIGEGKDYKLNLKNKEHKVIRTIQLPQKDKRSFYVPKTAPKDKEEPNYVTTQVYLRLKKDGDKPQKITKQNIKEVLYFEELEHETYPYKPEFLKYNDFMFILNQKLQCEVEFEEETYLIKNNELDIVVWGQTREEVEDAFCFSFYSMYLNYYLENDENLSDEAIQLKNKLKNTIKNVIDETKKN